jgi:hypothetical protein
MPPCRRGRWLESQNMLLTREMAGVLVLKFGLKFKTSIENRRKEEEKKRGGNGGGNGGEQKSRLQEKQRSVQKEEK